MTKDRREKPDKALAKSQEGGDMVPAKDEGLTMTDLMFLRPSDVIRLSLFDHEETKLFGILRDQMMEHRKDDTKEDWLGRCQEVEDWNRRRSKLMTAVFVNAVTSRYGPDSDAVQAFRLSYLMVAGDSSVEDARQLYGKESEVTRCFEAAFGVTVAVGGDKLTGGDILGLLGGGCDEGKGSATDSEASSPGL